jgi:MFS family permease
MQKYFSGGKAQLAVLAAFFANGAMMATWVARIPFVQSHLGMSKGTLGVVLLGLSFGVLTALSLTGGLIARYGSPRVTLAGALGMGLMLPLLLLAPSAWVLFVVLFVFSAFMSSMDVAMNEQAVLVEHQSGRVMMSSFHAFYSIGALTGSLISAGVADLTGFPPVLHAALAGLIFGGSMLLCYPHFIPAVPDKERQPVAFRLPERAVWLIGFMAFCAAVTEGAMADWSGVYLIDIFRTDAGFAALGYAAFSLTMTAGRLLGDTISNWRTPAFIVRLSGLAAALGLLVLVFSPSAPLSIVGFGMVGLGLSNVIPLLYRAGGNLPGISAGVGIAGVASIGYSGSLIGPPIIGFVAQHASLRVSFLLVALLVGSLFISGRRVEVQTESISSQED